MVGWGIGCGKRERRELYQGKRPCAAPLEISLAYVRFPAMPTPHALLTLSLTPGLGPTLTGRLLERFGSPEAALGASAADWGLVRGISDDGRLRAAVDEVVAADAVERELDLVAAAGAQLIGLGDDAYPKALSHIPDPP